MKISSIHFWKENLELTRPYTISYKTVTDVSVVFVEIQTNEGLFGLGATNPSPQVVGESVEDVMALLQTEKGFDLIVGRDIREIAGILADIGVLFSKNPGILAALDIALHDLWGKYLKIPVTQFYGQVHTKLPTSITIGIKNVEETLEEAAEYVGRGFRYMKVKTGQSIEEDLARLVKLREVYGKQIHIRIDANQGYTAKDFQSFFEKAASLDLELIEQPIPADQTGELLQLPWETARQIALDESLCLVEDALSYAVKPLHAGIFNIKLMKCGGVRNGLRIAELAQMVGIYLMWGCNDESIVSISAALHAAFASPHTRYLDLDGSLDLARDIVSGGFHMENGMMQIVDEPGLGLKRFS